MSPDVYERAAELAGQRRETLGLGAAGVKAVVARSRSLTSVIGLATWELVALACYHHAVATTAPVRLKNVGPDGDDEMFVVELHEAGKEPRDLLLITANVALGEVYVGTWQTEDGDDDYDGYRRIL